MVMMPDSLRFTPAQQTALDGIRAVAKVRHEKARRAAAARGRHSFPDLPFECSWAFEQQFKQETIMGKKRTIGEDHRYGNISASIMRFQ